MVGYEAVPETKCPQMNTNVNCAFHSLFLKSLFGIIEQFKKMDFALYTEDYFSEAIV
jgi:hypothetical protein